MSHKVILGIVAGCLATTSALAQDAVNGTVKGTFHSFDEANLYSLEAGADMAINRNFALGGGAGFYGGDEFDDTGFNLTARGMYMISPNTAIGLFVAYDSADDFDSTAFGAEIGYQSRGGSFEAYYGAIEGSDDPSGIDRGYGGFAFEFAVSPNFYLTADSQAQAITDGTTTAKIGTASIGARYQFAQGPSIFAEFGRIRQEIEIGSVSDSDEEDFIGVGADFTFGRNAGTILSNRSTFQTQGF